MLCSGEGKDRPVIVWVKEKKMEREYIAFISYRHLPLDMDIAKQLHKMIEHYNVPQKYRKDGRKTPGIVFRDQDELPLSSDLSGSIQTALDHSQFLILIATRIGENPNGAGRNWRIFSKHMTGIMCWWCMPRENPRRLFRRNC